MLNFPPIYILLAKSSSFCAILRCDKIFYQINFGLISLFLVIVLFQLALRQRCDKFFIPIPFLVKFCNVMYFTETTWWYLMSILFIKLMRCSRNIVNHSFYLYLVMSLNLATRISGTWLRSYTDWAVFAIILCILKIMKRLHKSWSIRK